MKQIFDYFMKNKDILGKGIFALFVSSLITHAPGWVDPAIGGIFIQPLIFFIIFRLMAKRLFIKSL